MSCHYKNFTILTHVYSTGYYRHASNLTRVLGDTCQIVTYSQLDACMLYTCQNLTRVLNTRVELDTCI
jgi:hypothetical protein